VWTAANRAGHRRAGRVQELWTRVGDNQADLWTENLCPQALHRPLQAVHRHERDVHRLSTGLSTCVRAWRSVSVIHRLVHMCGLELRHLCESPGHSEVTPTAQDVENLVDEASAGTSPKFVRKCLAWAPR